MNGKVGRVPLGCVGQDVKIRGVLGVRRTTDRGIPVDQCAGVERRIQPFVRVDDERIDVAQPREVLLGARGEHRRDAVSAVDVNPNVVGAADFDNTRDVIHDSEVRCAPRSDDRKDSVPIPGKSFLNHLAIEAPVGANRNLDDVDIHDARSVRDG